MYASVSISIHVHMGVVVVGEWCWVTQGWSTLLIWIIYIRSDSHVVRAKITWQTLNQHHHAPHAGANAQLQLLLENSKWKKGHNFVKKILRITSPTGMGSPFDCKQLLLI